MPSLLAVDAGVRTGLAAFDAGGGLLWCRSQNFGTAGRLRRAAVGLLDSLPGLALVVVEGGGRLGEVWVREAARRGTPCRHIAAETWREFLLLPRHRRHAAESKRAAGDLARRVIALSGLKGATSLRHDAAEAVCVGLWAALDAGWLKAPPGLRLPG